MIDPQTVQKILDTADIVDVVSDFVSLRRRGVNYVGLCPFHDEKTGSFTVSPSKGICKCFGCGKGGSPVNFIMEHEQLDYPDALRYLARKYNIPIEERELSEQEKASKSERESLFAINEWAKTYFTSNLKDTQEGKNIALSYFRERGISDASIEKFSLGYAINDFSAMCNAAKAKGYKNEFLLKTGLAGQSSKGELYDRFKGRVIFPVHTLSGKIVAFGGRVLVSSDKTAKYVNSPESEIYHKSNELYGIYQAKAGIVKSDKCYLVEGYTDVISMHQSGITNVVASSGTALTHGQIRMIHRLTTNITVLYDGDPAGIKASLRGINLLLEEGMNVKVVLLPEGEDPDSYAREHNSSDFIDFINKSEVDFIHFKINLLIDEAGKDPMKRANLIKDITQSIAVIPDQIVRSVYIKECSRLLDTPEGVIASEILKLRNKQKDDEAKKQGFNYTKTPPRTTNPSYRATPKSSPVAPVTQFAPPSIDPYDIPPPPDEEYIPMNIPPSYSQFDGDYSLPSLSEEPPIAPIVEEVPPFLPEDVYDSAPQVKVPVAKSKFYENEKEIMNFVVRHGNEIMLHEEDEFGNILSTSVGQFILEELNEFKDSNGSYLYTDLYNRMLTILEENIHNPNFQAFRLFVNYPDPDISMEAAELLSDKYTLSKIFTQYDDFTGDPGNLNEVEDYRRRMLEKHTLELNHGVSKVVLTYKYNIVVDMHAQMLAQLKGAECLTDMNKMLDVMKRISDLNKVINNLAPLVGKRVIK